jgi:hypothetical protein
VHLAALTTTRRSALKAPGHALVRLANGFAARNALAIQCFEFEMVERDVTLIAVSRRCRRFGEEFAAMRQPGQPAPSRENPGVDASTNL